MLKCLTKEEIKAYGGKAIKYSAKFQVTKRGIFPPIWGLKFPVLNLSAANTILVQLGLFYIDMYVTEAMVKWTVSPACLSLFFVMFWIKGNLWVLCQPTWTSNIMEWIFPLWACFLRPILTASLVWNTRETGDIHAENWINIITV